MTSNGSFYIQESSLYSNDDANTTTATTEINVSANISQVEMNENIEYAQVSGNSTTIADGTQVEVSQSIANTRPDENVQLDSCIQSVEDLHLGGSIQQFEYQEVVAQPNGIHVNPEESQSLNYVSVDAHSSQPELQYDSYVSLDAHSSQPELQYDSYAQNNSISNATLNAQTDFQLQQNAYSQASIQSEEIIQQDSYSFGGPQQSQSPLSMNPNQVYNQPQDYGGANAYAQVTTNTNTNDLSQSSIGESATYGLDVSSVTDKELTQDYYAVDADIEEGSTTSFSVGLNYSTTDDNSVNTVAAVNAGIGVVSAAVNVLSGDTMTAVQNVASSTVNAFSDPVATVQAVSNIVMSGARIGSSIGSWNEGRQKRKESQAQYAAVHGATNPSVISKVTVATQIDETLLVLSVLGQRLVLLEVVNLGELPQALAICRTACSQADSGDLLACFDTLDGTLQYTVTAALFFCAACWPMHIYRGFGTGVLNNFLWGCLHPDHRVAQTGGFTLVDRWIAFLKSMPREVQLLNRIPNGLSRIVPTYGKNERMERRRLMNAYKQLIREIEAKGHPQPRDRSFRVVSWHIPFATWNSPFTFKSSGHSCEDSIRWQMDPGRLLHAWTIGGHLDLNYGEMMWLPPGVAESIARWLVGLPGTTFKLLPSSAFDYSHLRLSDDTRRVILEEGFETVKAVRDPQAEHRRPITNQNMFVPAPPPIIRRRPIHTLNPNTAVVSQPPHQQSLVTQTTIPRPLAHQSAAQQHTTPHNLTHPAIGNHTNPIPHMNQQTIYRPTNQQQVQQQGSFPIKPVVNTPQQTAHLGAAHQNAMPSMIPRPAGPLPQHISSSAAVPPSNVPAHVVVSSMAYSPLAEHPPPNYQRLSSMPNIHCANQEGQHAIQPMGNQLQKQRIPSMPNFQHGLPHSSQHSSPSLSSVNAVSSNQDSSIHLNQHMQPNASQPPHQNPQGAHESLPKLDDSTELSRKIPMGGFSMSSPPQPLPSAAPHHSMAPGNPPVNPINRRPINPSSNSIPEGLSADSTAYPNRFSSNPQAQSPVSSMSRTSTVSSHHSSSSHSSAQPQSSMSSYTSQSTPTTSPPAPNFDPTPAPVSSFVTQQPQYPFPPITQQPAVTKPGSVKRRPAPPPPPPPEPIYRKVRAIHPFSAAEESELGFAVGDVLEVLKDDSDDGWLEARLDGKIGGIPASYVENI